MRTIRKPVGKYAARPLPGRSRDWVRMAGLYPPAVVFGLLLAGMSTLALALGRQTVALVLAFPLAAAALLLALTRFDWFVIGLIVIRPALDLLHQGTSSGLTNPASALGLVFTLSAGLWLWRRWRTGLLERVSPATGALFAMVAIFGASTLVSARPVWSGSAVIKVLAGALMFAVLEQLLPTEPAVARRLLWAVLLSAVIPVGIGISQALTSHKSSAFTDLSRVRGTFLHPNPFATYLIIILVVAVALFSITHGRERTLVVAAIVACGPLLMLTYARAAWVAALLAMAYLVSRRRRWVLAVLAGAVVVVAVSVPSVGSRIADLHSKPPVAGVPANSLSWRFGYWKSVVPLAERNPITGIGLEMVQRTTALGLQPHNVFVQAYVETGVLGLGALLVVVASFWSTLRRRVRDARTPLERVVAYAGIAIGLTILMQMFTENLLTETLFYWYFAAACAFGYHARLTSSAQLVGSSPFSSDSSR